MTKSVGARAVLIMSTIAVLAGCAVEESGGSEAKPAGKPDVTVKAARIVKEFERNELRADAKYKDKVVRVRGVVDKVDTETFDEKKYVLRVGGGGQYEILTVNCYGIPAEKLSAVDKGQRVTMVGNFDDGGDLGVELKNCRLVG